MTISTDYGKKRNDPRATEELVRIALTEQDEHTAWEPVTILHFRGTKEVLEKAGELCASTNAHERRLGVDILGQLGIPNRAFPNECFELLAEILSQETNPDVLSSIGVAFGHLQDPRAIDRLVPLKNHPDMKVRLGVVHGLSGQEHDSAITALIELSRDNEGEVRDWATFALGSLIGTDKPDLREALFARTTDADGGARVEALVGLAKRKDPRAVELLQKELSSRSLGTLALEAAAALGDPLLLPALQDLKVRWTECSPSDAELLDDAILRCTPAR